MLNLANGFDDQAFFILPRRPLLVVAQPPVGLRNARLKRDLITATPVQRVILDLPEAQADVVNQSNSADRWVRKFPGIKDVPLVTCYPFKEGKRYSTMLYSHRIDTSTKVTLELPFDPMPSMKLYRLAAEILPRTTSTGRR